MRTKILFLYLLSSLLISVVSLILTSCSENIHNNLSERYDAILINFSDFKHTIELQDSIINKKIMFDTIIKDHYRKLNNEYLLAVNFTSTNEILLELVCKNSIDIESIDSERKITLVAEVSEVIPNGVDNKWRDGDLYIKTAILIKGELIAYIQE